MQYTNCPRCNMYLAPGSQECPNCRLNLMQYSYQPQQHYHLQGMQQGMPGGSPGMETPKERLYRQLLIGVFGVVAFEFLLSILPAVFGMGMYSLTRFLNWIPMLAWMGFPMLLAMVVPKDLPSRQALITVASIWLAIRLIAFVYLQFFYYNPFGGLGF